MDVIWLAPWAWVGLVTVALPIAVHLLTRQQAPVLRFPTLRFIRPTRLAALRWRRLEDLALLGIRLAVLAAAVAALAAPVFVSAERQQQWRARVARAVVMSPMVTQDRANAEPVIREGYDFRLEFEPSLDLILDGLAQLRDGAISDRHAPSDVDSVDA